MKEKIKTIYKRWINTRDSIQSEESTKQSMILPFLSALGYDVFNPEEITPEKECEVNGKKGEKIDYAVSRDGEQLMICAPIFLITSLLIFPSGWCSFLCRR